MPSFASTNLKFLEFSAQQRRQLSYSISVNLQFTQDGSRRWSPCWYEICLLSEFPREGYDPPLDLPPSVQVCRPRDFERVAARIEKPFLLTGSRVGDIVDIKVNGAVQKGMAVCCPCLCRCPLILHSSTSLKRATTTP